MKNKAGVTMAFLPCIYCAGKGLDPFGIMSPLSDCQVCLGKSVVKVPVPYVACAHCRGSGAIKRLTCTVCCGKGKLAAAVGPTIVCPDCQGSGDDNSNPAMDCLTCRGRGRIDAP